MLFNSYVFIIFFLPVTFFTYFFLTGKGLIRYSKIFLVLASLFFYSWWNIVYLPLILSSILFNYILGYHLNRKIANAKLLLIFGISSNVALLGYFKYTDFFIENFNLAFDTSIPLQNIMLPLAISFFTFQQIAYLVDSYRNETHEYDFINYALFVTFFPQLIAGPIVHHKEMMPQFTSLRSKNIHYDNIAKGLFIFGIGLFKKVVIADSLSPFVTAGFDTSTTLTLLEGWATSLAYTLQLYFDFSGYTDMAIGSALLFSIRLPINFNSPYKAHNIQDFWRRWHITLSRFLRDYIYVPLGGNRGSSLSLSANLMITFLIGGIWHGAAWTFVVWGALHGIAMIIYRLWKQFHIQIPVLFAWLITFNFINITWVFFRANSFDDALKVLKAMSGLSGVTLPSVLSQFSWLKGWDIQFGYTLSHINGSISLVLLLLTGSVIILLPKNSNELTKHLQYKTRTLLFTALLYILSLVFSEYNQVSEFIYFNF